MHCRPPPQPPRSRNIPSFRPQHLLLFSVLSEAALLLVLLLIPSPILEALSKVRVPPYPSSAASCGCFAFGVCPLTYVSKAAIDPHTKRAPFQHPGLTSFCGPRVGALFLICRLLRPNYFTPLSSSLLSFVNRSQTFPRHCPHPALPDVHHAVHSQGGL